MLCIQGNHVFVRKRAFAKHCNDEIVKELLIEDALVYDDYSSPICHLDPPLHSFKHLLTNP